MASAIGARRVAQNVHVDVGATSGVGAGNAGTVTTVAGATTVIGARLGARTTEKIPARLGSTVAVREKIVRDSPVDAGAYTAIKIEAVEGLPTGAEATDHGEISTSTTRSGAAKQRLPWR